MACSNSSGIPAADSPPVTTIRSARRLYSSTRSDRSSCSARNRMLRARSAVMSPFPPNKYCPPNCVSDRCKIFSPPVGRESRSPERALLPRTRRGARRLGHADINWSVPIA